MGFKRPSNSLRRMRSSTLFLGAEVLERTGIYASWDCLLPNCTELITDSDKYSNQFQKYKYILVPLLAVVEHLGSVFCFTWGGR